MLLNDRPTEGACAPFSAVRLSIIVPVHNQWSLTSNCIASLLTFPPGIPFEIIVVDDGSTDETVDRMLELSAIEPRLRLVRNQPPHRFACACNCGAGVARGELLLFMNNDIEAIGANWFEPLLGVLQQRPEVGIVAPRLLFPNNTVQHCGKIWSVGADGLPQSQHYLYEQPSVLSDTMQGGAYLTVTGACILVQQEQFFQIGPFDERYENGWEDDDLCLAYCEQGLASWVCPESTLIHHQGGTLKAEAAVLERYIAILRRKNLRLDGNDPLLEGLMERIRVKAERFEALWQSNRQLFALKWGERIRQYLEPIPAAGGAATIVVVTYNSAGTIASCLTSVLGTMRTGDRVVVVDNHSCDATCSIIEDYSSTESLQCIKNQDNRGFSVASNQGIRLAATPFVVLLNPDTIVTPGWLDHLSAHFADERVAAVGPLSNFAAGRQSVAVHWQGPLPQSIAPDSAAEQLYTINRGKQEESKLLIGFCLMLRRSVVQEAGCLDERLFLGNDDLELSWRLRLYGYRLAIALDTFIWHEGQHSFKTASVTTTGRLVQESSDALYRILATHYGPDRVPTPQELWDVSWFSPENAKYNPIVAFKHVLSLPVAYESPRPVKKQPLVSVVVLTFNQWSCTEECLAAIERHTPESYELIVVDNGSSDCTPERLQALAATDSRYRLLLNHENRGFAAGCNQGIQLARGEYILLLNNDVVVTPEWLSGLLECHAACGHAGIVGPLTNSASGIQVVPEAGYQVAAGELDRFALQFRCNYRFRRVPVRRLAGFCMLMSRSLLSQIGLLDEQFGTGNYEDDDICFRATVAGYQNFVAADVFVHHYGSMSFKGNNIDYRSALARNAALFQQKWSRPVHDPVEGRKIAVCRAIEQAELMLYDEQTAQAATLVRQAVDIYSDDLRLQDLQERIEQAVTNTCFALQQIQKAKEQGNSEYADALLLKSFVLEPWQSCLQKALFDLGKCGTTGLTHYVDASCRLYPTCRGLARLRVELAALEKHVDLLVWSEAFLAVFGFDDQVLQAGRRQRQSSGPYRQESTAGKSIALCMIVKDEERNLARCLASCKPVVHEIVVVDTGSSDHTREIAELFGAKVLKVLWNGDFSAARNQSLRLATSDWILVMDADEVISPRDYQLFSQILEDSLPDQAYIMTTRNYTFEIGYEGFVACHGEYPESESGAGWTPSDKVRLFPNRAGILFKGVIHEMVEDSVQQAGFSMTHHPVPVHHFGRLVQDSNRLKQEQYLRLGLTKLAENPDDCKAIYELAVQAAELGQYQTAERLWRELLSKQPDFARGWFNLGYALLRQARVQESMVASNVALQIDPDYLDALVNKTICELCIFTGEGAFKSVVQALQQFPGNHALLGLAALGFYRVGRSSEGEEMLRQMKHTGISCARLIQGVYGLMLQTADASSLEQVKQALVYVSEISAPEVVVESTRFCS